MGGEEVIRVPCAHCGHVAKTRIEHVGRSGKCKQCGQSFVISQDYLKICEICGERMALDAPACPHCGHVLRRRAATVSNNHHEIVGDTAPASDVRRSFWRSAVADRASFTLSLAALIMAALALCLMVAAHPPGSRLALYDFSTPHNAALSKLKIAVDKDDVAAQELHHLIARDELTERANSFEIHHEVAYGEYRVLFVSYDKDGVKLFEVESYRNDGESGLWLPTYLSAYNTDDPELRAQIEAWEETGTF